MKKIVLAALCAALITTSASFAKTVEILGDPDYTDADVKVSTTADAAYYRYVNARYGSAIDIPVTVDNGWEANNGDGCSFADTATGAKFLVYSSHNVLSFDLKGMRNIDLVNANNPKLLYQAQGKDWYILSWQEKDKIFYKKMYVTSSMYSSFVVIYPADKAEQYKPVIAHMEKSFEPGFTVDGNESLQK